MIAQHGLRPIDLGQSEVIKGKYFDCFNVGTTHADVKYVMCRACVENSDFHIARISRGKNQKDAASTTNMRTHLYVHHDVLFTDLLKREGRVSSTAGSMNAHFGAKTKKRGAPQQDEERTLDGLLSSTTQ